MILVHVKVNKDNTMKYEDFIQNKNVEPTLINLKYIREITPFDSYEISRVRFGFNDHLHGSNSSLWLDYVNAYHVTESIQEIQQLIAGAK
jgi:hypothetical protein